MSKRYQYLKKHRINRKKLMADCLGGKCARCGYNKCGRALDFHHIDAESKSFSIGSVLNKSLSLMIEEAKKCVLLCTNCHREFHDDLWEIESIDIPKFIDVITPAIEDKKGECSYCKKRCFLNRRKFCSPWCFNLGRRKVNRPTKEKLRLDIENHSWVFIGKKYGVTDNAVRKWARTYELI